MRYLIIALFLLKALVGVGQITIGYSCHWQYGLYVGIIDCCEDPGEITFTIHSNQLDFPKTVTKNSFLNDPWGNGEFPMFFLGCFDLGHTYSVSFDYNGEKRDNIDQNDIILLNAYLNGTYSFDQCQLDAADVDLDGEVTWHDLEILELYVNGIGDLPYNGLTHVTEAEGGAYTFYGFDGAQFGNIHCSSKSDYWEIVDEEPCETEIEDGFIEGNQSSFGCSYSEAYTFCKGDTILIQNLYDSGLIHFEVEIVSPIYSEVDSGEDYSQLVMQSVGKGCLCVNLKEDVGFNEPITTFDECVLINVIDNQPLEIHNSIDNSNSITACIGEAIQLTALNSSSTDLEWAVSNGQLYANNEVTIAFDTPGVYEVELSGNGECKSCQDPAYLTVTVLDGEVPTISCLGTVCQGDTSLYYTDLICDSYIWSVSSEGVIVDGGGSTDSYISVDWVSGSVGELTLTTPDCIPDACDDSVTEVIPIIGGAGTIDGPIDVCRGDLDVYTLPLLQGVEYEWSLNQNGVIVDGQGTNIIQVEWDEWGSDDTAQLTVDYESCTANCSGSALLEIELKSRFALTHISQELCEGGLFVVGNTLGIDLNWTLEFPDGRDSTISANRWITIDAKELGDYQLVAENVNGQTCNLTDTLEFTVISAPTFPLTGINGPSTICKQSPSEYSVDVGSDVVASWTFYDGTTLVSSAVGNPVFYTWQSDGPYMVDVTLESSGSGCESETQSFTLSNTLEISGDDNVCVNTSTNYSLPNDLTSGIQWKVEPVNTGHIIATTDSGVEVFWQEPGNHFLIGNICGIGVSLAVEVIAPPTYTLTLSGEICFGETGLLDIVTDATNLTAVYDDDQTLISSINPTAVDAGIFEVFVTSPEGCIDSSRLKITERDSFGVRIFSPFHRTFCLPHPEIGLLSEALQGTYTYQWLVDGLPILGATTNEYFTNVFGDYQLVITDVNGCEAISNILSIIEDCDDGSGSGGTGGPTVIVEIIPSITDGDGDGVPECNNYVFDITQPVVSTSFNWNFGDPESGVNNTAVGLSASHQFTSAGYFTVTAVGNMNNELGIAIITVPVVADFDFESMCPGGPVEFTDASSLLPDLTGLVYSWDFGDPASGGSNTASSINPIHTFSGPGLYTVILIVTDDSGCDSEVIHQVEVVDTDVNVLLDGLTCQGNSLALSTDITIANLEYAWDFGDPLSGFANTSDLPLTYHTYEVAGTYKVTVVMTDIDQCTYTTTRDITISDNTLFGTIAMVPVGPKCPDEEANLIVTTTGVDYLWSTGEMTQEISVLDPGIYTVTITDVNGCVYVPPPVTVNNSTLDQQEICGTVYPEDEIPIKNCDSLIVCHGEEFELAVDGISSTTYDWTVGDSQYSTLRYDELSALPVGEHWIGVTLTSPSLGCSYAIDPFYVVINAIPETPTIVNEGSDNCEGGLRQLSVSSPQVGVTYHWNTEEIGETITVFNDGEYWVEAINDSGCRVKSNSINLYPNPRLPAWLTGCLEVCFPQQYCIKTDEAYTYQLYQSGVPVGPISNTQDVVDISGPGDYQVEVTNGFGCSLMTDILSLSPAPNAQTVAGIVYIDNDGNGKFDDTIDEGLPDISVKLMLASSIIDCLITDGDGAYDFGLVDYSNLEVVIDTVGVYNYFADNLTGDLESILSFDDCIEDKELDFPLIPQCIHKERELQFQVCEGQTMDFEGVSYEASDLDTLRFVTTNGCDSIVYLAFEAYPTLTIDYDIQATCETESSGGLSINSMSLTGVTFTLDGVLTDAADIGGVALTVGDHILEMVTADGCPSTLDFEVPQYPTPVVDLMPNHSCMGQNSGEVVIEVTNGSDFTTSLESAGSIDFEETDTGYINLPVGTYTLTLEDVTSGCSYEYPFSIQSMPEPEVELNLTQSCEGQDNGNLEIQVYSGSPQFALDDQSAFTYSDTYTDLVPGDHMLYTLSESGCMDSMAFSIDVSLEPQGSLFTQETCINQSGGTVSILGVSGAESYSIDGVNYQNNPYFENLAEGDYILYTTTAEGCNYEEPFVIVPAVEPSITLTTTASCELSANGNLAIGFEGSEGFLLFELDEDGNQVSQQVFENLDVGLHILTVYDANGCEYYLPFEIEQLPDPVYSLETINTCKSEDGGMLVIQNGQVDCQYSIDGGAYTSETMIGNLEAGTHTLTILSEYGCQYVEEFLIEVYEDPTVELAVSANCHGENQGELFLSQIEGVSQYGVDDVNEIDDNLHFTDLASGDHVLYTLSEYGCLDSVYFAIDELPMTELLVSSIPSCAGLENGGIIIENAADFDSVFVDSNPLIATESLMEVGAGQYSIIAIDPNGCTTSTTTEVREADPLEVTWPEVLANCETYSLLIKPTIESYHGKLDYLWSDGSTQDQVTTFQSGSYSVTISDDCDQVTKTWDLDFDESSESVSVFVPNIFMPKGSSPHDCFMAGIPEGLELVSYSLSVYDRWGSLIFVTEDPQDCWDGRYDSQYAESGVYVYINRITYLECGGEKAVETVGDVTLIY